MAGNIISGVTAASAIDTPQLIEAYPGNAFGVGHFTLNTAAGGPARIGASNVSVASGIGLEVQPGDTVTLPMTGAPNPYRTGLLYVAFTAAGATDTLSWTLVKN